MKNLICTLALIGLLTACNNESPTPVNEQKEVINENTSPDLENVPLIEANLLQYRPEVGTKRTYMNGEDEIYIQEVIAADEEYLQLTISLSGAPTTHIYRWTNNEIALIYENSSPSNPRDNLLEEFESTGVIETYIDVDDIQADWQLIGADEKVTVPYDTFKNVLVLQKTTDEVEGEDTIYTRYFAEGHGMIKETFELTGEYGYKDEANLSTVDSLKE
ncbi:hypothetical protein [Litchfieldia alkalitelluris]|uniref:hypothetical protein n=1 Tax=Litchfieldia alkalitelluris TaxID=304268 RepID=UPI0009980CDA|nr:hypothetical protein [Litchfieldia alkalitelluris]